jgi:hypothetical protein
VRSRGKESQAAKAERPRIENHESLMRSCLNLNKVLAVIGEALPSGQTTRDSRWAQNPGSILPRVAGSDTIVSPRTCAISLLTGARGEKNWSGGKRMILARKTLPGRNTGLEKEMGLAPDHSRNQSHFVLTRTCGLSAEPTDPGFSCTFSCRLREPSASA